jgi:polyisoprenoid-binding protein YceI
MSLQAGIHTIGPENGSLLIKTGREGAAARAGHDLVLEATNWDGTVQVGDTGAVQLNVDPAGIEVRTGTGGAKALSDKDRGDVKKNMDGKVLGSSPIRFQSTSVAVADGAMDVSGDVSIAGASQPISVPLTIAPDGTVSGSVTLSQSSFGIKQYKALMGALKVADDVEVQIEARLPTG